jgi:cytochrome c oxidase assembly protein Cox11
MRQFNAAVGVYTKSTLVIKRLSLYIAKCVKSTLPSTVMHTKSTFVIAAIVPVYRRMCQVNASLGVHAKSTHMIAAIAPVYRRMCQVNASLGVHARSTLLSEAIVPVYNQLNRICQTCIFCDSMYTKSTLVIKVIVPV